jgi:hypothetical protein
MKGRPFLAKGVWAIPLEIFCNFTCKILHFGALWGTNVLVIVCVQNVNAVNVRIWMLLEPNTSVFRAPGRNQSNHFASTPGNGVFSNNKQNYSNYDHTTLY